MAIIFVLLLVLWLAIIYLPFAMPNWRAFLSLCAAYLLIGFGVRFGVATYSSAEVPAVLVMIGNIWLDYLVWAVPVPVIARAVVLSARSLGLSGKRLVALNVVGVLALPGLWLGEIGLDRWERRSAPADCMARTVSLTLSGVDGSVEWDQPLRLYLGPDIRNDSRYLFYPAHRRSVCRDTSNGTERLTIKAISVDVWRPWPKRCEAPDIQPWEQRVCTRFKEPGSVPLPQKLVFFDPNGIRLGDFGIPNAPTDGGFPLPDGERIVSAANAEVGTVTAVCRSQPLSNGLIACRMRREIRDGIDVFWEGPILPENIDDALLQSEAFARNVCSSIFDMPDCAAVSGTKP